MASHRLSDTISEIIKNSPVTTKPMTLYRGDRFNSWKNKKIHQPFNEKSFVSTTLSIDVAKNFTLTESRNYTKIQCCLYKILVKPGSNVLFISGVSQIKPELEFLIDMNTNFKIISEPLVSNHTEQFYNKETQMNSICKTSFSSYGDYPMYSISNVELVNSTTTGGRGRRK
jgi:hypothetical protein